ncbi:MAG: glycerol-3-phosphate 1-O-acyltransferase PlsY [Opitutaceae bacterium]|nr:glycerol-3-phosphate 1-O-acyltransferase PlsY [Verrucomicrobiales bacterium]
MLGYFGVAIVAYLLGSIPTGYLVARAKGIDIRSVGSGNIGATNVFRILGRTAGIVVLSVDAFKGWFAVWWLASWVMRHVTSSGIQEEMARLDYLRIVAAFSVILGHNYTCWLRFKGGKGVATSAGVLLALFPVVFAINLVVWLVVFAISRYVSLASICAAITLPVAAWALGSGPRLVTLATIMSVLAIYKHKANIQRLLNGTENRMGAKSKMTEESK